MTTHRLVKRLLAAALMLIGPWGCTSSPARRERAEPGDGGQEVCIGRFTFEVSPDLVESGRGMEIHRIKVHAVPPGPPEALRAHWEQRLEEVRSKRSPLGHETPILSELELRPGVPAVWYHPNSGTADQRSLVVFFPVSDHALILERSCLPGAEANIEQMMRLMMEAYVPGKRDGFCFGPGSDTSGEANHEYTRIVLRHRVHSDIELVFATQMTERPERERSSGVDEAREFVQATGGKVEVLRERSRRVAGMRGEEHLLLLRFAHEEPLLDARWAFAGEKGSSVKPRVDLRAKARPEHRAELEALWERVLSSLESHPPQPPR